MNGRSLVPGQTDLSTVYYVFRRLLSFWGKSVSGDPTLRAILGPSNCEGQLDSSPIIICFPY